MLMNIYVDAVEAVIHPFKPVGKNIDLLKLDESRYCKEYIYIFCVLNIEPMIACDV